MNIFYVHEPAAYITTWQQGTHSTCGNIRRKYPMQTQNTFYMTCKFYAKPLGNIYIYIYINIHGLVQDCSNSIAKRGRLSLSAFLRTEDIGVHIVHISRLIINLYIAIIIFPHIDNPRSAGYNQPKKKTIKIINEKSEGPINLTNHWRKRLWISLHVEPRNGSWCIGIKGEMSGTVCVTFTWDIYIYMSCL